MRLVLFVALVASAASLGARPAIAQNVNPNFPTTDGNVFAATTLGNVLYFGGGVTSR